MLLAFGVAAIAALVVLAAKAVLVLFGGCLLALVLHALASGLARRTSTPYGRCVAALVFAIIVGAVAMLVLAGPRLFDQLVELVNRLPGAIHDVLTRFRHAPIGRIIAPTTPRGGADAQAVAASAFVALDTTLEVLGGLAVVFFVGVYGAARPSDYVRVVLAVTPKHLRRRVLRALHRVANNLTRWLLGRLVSMLFVGVTCAIAFSLLHVPLALSLAVLAGLLTFVEYIGAIVSAIPPLVLSFTRSPTDALSVLIVYSVLHLIEGYVLTPLLARATVRFPPALTLAGQIVLGTLLGPLGLTFSTPLLILFISAAAPTLLQRPRVGDGRHSAKEAGHTARPPHSGWAALGQTLRRILDAGGHASARRSR